MNRPMGEEASGGARGAFIVGAAVLLGLGIVATFDGRGTAVGVNAQGVTGEDAPKTTSPPKGGSTTTSLAATTTTIPLKQAKDIKVLVANGTDVTGAALKVADALKPACYQLPKPISASTAVVKEKRPTTIVYSTSGYEREAELLATQLGLKKDAVAPVPDPSPIPTKGAPSYNLLVVMGKDFADAPPPPVATGIPCATTAAGGSTTTTRASGGTATTRRSAVTTTTKASTTTTKAATTTTTRATTTTT